MQEKQEDSKQRKKFELLTLPGTSDVFKRLAKSHTLASQAKVIQRSSIDKDSLESAIDDKRKSLSDIAPLNSDNL